MKNIILVFFTILLNYFNSSSQEVHLSYNLYGEKTTKTIKGETIIFFIGENKFIYTQNKHFYKSVNINKKRTHEVVDIKTFLKKAYQLKLNKIKGKNKVHISKKNKIFKKIFLYERKDEYISIYCVDWVDAIID